MRVHGQAAPPRSREQSTSRTPRREVGSSLLAGAPRSRRSYSTSDFSALQAALGAREGPGHKAAIEAVFYAVDLLHLKGVDLQPAPLLKRKAKNTFGP